MGDGNEDVECDGTIPLVSADVADGLRVMNGMGGIAAGDRVTRTVCDCDARDNTVRICVSSRSQSSRLRDVASGFCFLACFSILAAPLCRLERPSRDTCSYPSARLSTIRCCKNSFIAPDITRCNIISSMRFITLRSSSTRFCASSSSESVSDDGVDACDGLCGVVDDVGDVHVDDVDVSEIGDVTDVLVVMEGAGDAMT